MKRAVVLGSLLVVGALSARHNLASREKRAAALVLGLIATGGLVHVLSRKLTQDASDTANLAAFRTAQIIETLGTTADLLALALTFAWLQRRTPRGRVLVPVVLVVSCICVVLALRGSAPGAGTLSVLRPDDYVITTYRDHGQALARGMMPRTVMAELLGKIDGCSRGKGGSMHLFDRNLNVLVENQNTFNMPAGQLCPDRTAGPTCHSLYYNWSTHKPYEINYNLPYSVQATTANRYSLDQIWSLTNGMSIRSLTGVQ